MEDESGLFVATSPDLPGLLAARPARGDLDCVVPCCIRQLYALCDVNVVVARLEGADDEFTSWVAVPVDVLERARELTLETRR